MPVTLINKNTEYEKKLLNEFLGRGDAVEKASGDAGTREVTSTSSSSANFSNDSGNKKTKKKSSVVKALLQEPAPRGLHNLQKQQEFHKSLMKEHCKKKIAIIFVLHIKPKAMYGFQKDGPDAKETLILIQKARDMFEAEIFSQPGLSLVKYLDKRIFVKCDTPQNAINGMFRANELIEYIHSPKGSMNVSSGCHMGLILEVPPNDYYGDPVNVASKLSEDIAKPGEILVSFGGKEEQMKQINSFQSIANFIPKRSSISDVIIEYHIMTKYYGGGCCRCCRCSQCCSPRLTYAPTKEYTEDDMRYEEKVMLQSDLSGMTKLTKKFGVLHSLKLILHCRAIFHRIASSRVDGGIMKFDSDNIICIFDDCAAAARFVQRVKQEIDFFNAGKDKDYQLRIAFGIAKGQVLLTESKDIIGDAWDDCCLLAEIVAEDDEVLITEVVKEELTNTAHRRRMYKFDHRDGNEIAPDHYNLRM